MGPPSLPVSSCRSRLPHSFGRLRSRNQAAACQFASIAVRMVPKALMQADASACLSCVANCQYGPSPSASPRRSQLRSVSGVIPAKSHAAARYAPSLITARSFSWMSGVSFVGRPMGSGIKCVRSARFGVRGTNTKYGERIRRSRADFSDGKRLRSRRGERRKSGSRHGAGCVRPKTLATQSCRQWHTSLTRATNLCPARPACRRGRSPRAGIGGR